MSFKLTQLKLNSINILYHSLTYGETPLPKVIQARSLAELVVFFQLQAKHALARADECHGVATYANYCGLRVASTASLSWRA